MSPKFAAIQLDTIAGEVNHNVHKALQWAKRAFDQDAQYVFFHEGLTADYTPEPMRCARPLDSAEVYGFTTLAARYNGYVALGLNELWKGRPYIAMVWIGPGGVIDVYRKSYLWPIPSRLTTGDFEQFARTYVPHEAGYRLERGILGAGNGTKIIKVGKLRIGCVICADGSQPCAWTPFKRDKPDLIFWQNNRRNVATPTETDRAREMRTPMVCTNRCGFSHFHFQEGGACMIADDGTMVAKANEIGEEEMIFARYADLLRLPVRSPRKKPTKKTKGKKKG